MLACRVDLSFNGNVVGRQEIYNAVAAVDPKGNPLETLALLSCKSIALRYTAAPSWVHIALRKILLDFYSLYSQAIAIAVTESREGFLLHSAGCKPSISLEHIGSSVRISVDGCIIRYECLCGESQQGGPGHRSRECSPSA